MQMFYSLCIPIVVVVFEPLPLFFRLPIEKVFFKKYPRTCGQGFDQDNRKRLGFRHQMLGIKFQSELLTSSPCYTE